MREEGEDIKAKIKKLKNLSRKEKDFIRERIKCLRWMRGWGVGVYEPNMEEKKATVKIPNAKQFAVNISVTLIVTLIVTTTVVGVLRAVGYLP